VADPGLTGIVARALLIAIGLIVSFGCGPKAPEPRAVERRAPPPAPRFGASDLDDAGWAEVESRRQSLVVRLPQRDAWRLDDRQPWFLARHPGTGSELKLRTWLAPRLVRPEECEDQARLWLRSIPASHPEAVVRRRLRAPAGFSGELVVGVEPGNEGLEGHALAFGAGVGRCYAAVFTTRVSGTGSEDALGRRLVLIVEGVLERVQERKIEDRIQAVPH
jgi:hypothetical protein